MALEPGQTLSHYRLVEKIGEGGMGVVWKAIDTTLDREVAIKILPDAFADNPERLARFEREAKLLASLNHANIATIHSVHEMAGLHFLAMEFVDGEDLAKRLARGPIPVDEALPIARQLADALEAAHEAGVVHRDLKPANIKAREDGTVKILDFGLAKALDQIPEGDLSKSPTLTAAATEQGVIMGTAAYMSPEQARGKSVDKRADIWAFGVVVYEMLTGKRAFPGEAMADCLARIIERDPDYDTLPPGVPPSIRRLVRRCLVKDQTERLRDIGEARIEIKRALATPPNDAYRETDEPPGGGTDDVPALGEEENRRRKETEGYKVGGLTTAAAGIGVGIFLYFLEPGRPVYVVGLVPLLVGLTLLLYGMNRDKTVNKP